MEALDLEKIYETMIQNAQGGDSYLIRFKYDPIEYLGIPIVNISLASENEFTFRVLEPKECAGIFVRCVEDIESFKKP